MPNNVFGNSYSNDNGNEIDKVIFVQKPYLRSKNIEANIEEAIIKQNQCRIKKIT